MDLLIALVLALVGVVAGTVSGMFGVGGGVIVVPSLVLLTGLGFRAAVAASLLFMIFTAPFGVLRYARARNVDFRKGMVLAGTGVLGVALGAWVGPHLTDRALVLGFGLFLVGSARNLAYGRLPEAHHRSPLLVGAVGFVSGFVSKLFGIGGGIVIVPSLVFTGVAVHLAIGTSLFVVFTNALIASAINLQHPGAWALWSLPIAAGALLGIQLGARQALKTHGARLRRWFALLMCIVALQLVKGAF